MARTYHRPSTGLVESYADGVKTTRRPERIVFVDSNMPCFMEWIDHKVYLINAANPGAVALVDLSVGLDDGEAFSIDDQILIQLPKVLTDLFGDCIWIDWLEKECEIHVHGIGTTEVIVLRAIHK